MTEFNLRREIHRIADSSPGQWSQAKLPYEYREQLLDRAIDAFRSGDLAGYVPLDAVLAPPVYQRLPTIGRKAIPKAVRKAVYERDGYACRVCQAVDNLSIDHVLALSRGGSDEFGNLQTLCLPCNMAKGARDA